MTPTEPKSPASPHRRKSIIGYFGDLGISESPLGDAQTAKSSPGMSFFSHASASPRSKNSLLRRTFRKGWPPTLRRVLFTKAPADLPVSKPSSTLRMSDLYRLYDDKWASTDSIDKPADVSADFSVVSSLMDDVHQLCQAAKSSGDAVADVLIRSMAEVVYGSNFKARKGLGLDETLKICMAIFDGEKGVEYTERSEEYQAQLEAMIRSNIEPSTSHAIRSRREVVQHAAAFQHIVDVYVRQDKALSQELIKETHAILVRGLGGEAAGFINIQEYGGIYRTADVFVGTHRFTPPAKVPEAMRSFVKNLAQEVAESETTSTLDPFAIAAKYCDRFVSIHPFRDGNGRMCRLILNAILIKYAGIAVSVGEHDQSRDEYINTARESRELGGHAGALATLVLKEGGKGLRKMKDRLKNKMGDAAG